MTRSEPTSAPRAVHAYLAIIAASLAAFSWVMPTHQPPWLSFHAELAMACAAGLLWCWMLTIEPKRPSVWPWPAVVCLLCVAIPTGQWAAHLIVFRADAFVSASYLIGAALAVAMGYRAVAIWGVDRCLESLAWVLLAGGLASMWLALYQWLQLEYLLYYTTALPPGARAGANLNQPNQFATLLVLSLAAVAVLRSGGRLSISTSVLLIALFGFGLAMTQSRTGAAEALVLAGWLLVKRRSLPVRLGWVPVLVAAVIVVAMVPVWAAASAWFGNEAGRDVAEVLSAGTRSTHWSSVVDAIMRKPWTGYGWNQMALAQFDVVAGHAATHETISYSHDLALDLMLWNGVPLGLTLALAIAAWGWVAARRAGERGTVIALGMVGVVMLHALLEFPLYYSYFLLPVGMLVGGLSAALMPRAAITVRPAWGVALLMVGIGSVVVVTRDYVGLESDFRIFRLEQARIKLEPSDLQVSQPWVLDHIAAYLQFARTREHEHMSEAELTAMQAVARRFPSGPNLVRYASALMLNGRPDEATDVLRKVCKTEKPQTCDQLQHLWTRLGEQRNATAAYQWPTE